MQITLERLEQIINDVKDQYQREEEQAIMQRNMDKAIMALAGKDACTRLKNNLGMRVEMDANMVAMNATRKRA